MRTAVVSLCLAGVLGWAAPSTCLADQKSHRKAAEDLLIAMKVNKQLENSIDQMLELQIKTNPGIAQVRGSMKRFFDKYMSWESLRNELIDIYVSAFTEEELKQITAFYKTPAGRKMVEKTPELMAKGMQLGVSRVQENQSELEKMIREDQAKGTSSK